MDAAFYSSAAWKHARAQALQRDNHRCTVALILGGECSAVLHVHHIERPEDGGSLLDLGNLGTVCSVHHSVWEALARSLRERRVPKRPRVRARANAAAYRSFRESEAA